MSNGCNWPTPEIRAMRRPPLIAPTGELPLSTQNGPLVSSLTVIRLAENSPDPLALDDRPKEANLR